MSYNTTNTTNTMPTDTNTTNTPLKVLSQDSSELNTVMNLFSSLPSGDTFDFDDAVDSIEKEGYLIDRNFLTLIVSELIRLRMNKAFQCFICSKYFVHISLSFFVSSAIRYANLELLKWMYETHSHWFSKSIHPFNFIEIDEQFELIDWLYSIGYVPDSFVLNMMAMSNLFENLKFLVSRGCEMNKQLIMASLSSTNPAIFCWLIDNGCPHDKKRIVNFYQVEIVSGCSNQAIIEKIKTL